MTFLEVTYINMNGVSAPISSQIHGTDEFSLIGVDGSDGEQVWDFDVSVDGGQRPDGEADEGVVRVWLVVVRRMDYWGYWHVLKKVN